MRVCSSCRNGFQGPGWTCPACGREPLCRDGIRYFAPALCGGDGTDATYSHEPLDRAERSHFWFRARAKLIVWALTRYFPSVRSVLDVGCGRGSVLDAMRARFPSAFLAGGELLDDGLRLARRRLPSAVELYQIDARDLPFDAEFEVVTSFDVLEHLDDDAAAVRQFFRAVAPGGGVIISVPQHRWLWSAVDDYSHHRRRYSRGELVTLLQQAGFVVERATSFVTALLPLMIMSRLRRKTLTADFDPTAELKVGAVTNVLLERVLDGERALVQAGVSLPLGSSLLVVARRPLR